MLRVSLTVAGLLLSIAPSGAPAAPPSSGNGCSTVQLGTFGFVYLHNCRYTAKGPGRYTALTLNHWRISVNRDGQGFKTIVADGRPIAQVMPRERGGASLWAPNSGTIATQAGDIVDVAIYPDPFEFCMEEDENYFCDPDEEEPPISLPHVGYIEAFDA